MAYFFEIDDANNVVRITWSGRMTDDELTEGMAASRRFLASRPGIRAIADCSAVETFDVATETVKKMAMGVARGEEKSVVVMVASADVAYGLARMLATLTEDRRPNRLVVRTLQEAYDLLEIKEPHFTRM